METTELDQYLEIINNFSKIPYKQPPLIRTISVNLYFRYLTKDKPTSDKECPKRYEGKIGMDRLKKSVLRLPG